MAAEQSKKEQILQKLLNYVRLIPRDERGQNLILNLLNRGFYFPTLQFIPDSSRVNARPDNKTLAIPKEIIQAWVQDAPGESKVWLNNSGDMSRLYFLYLNLIQIEEQGIEGAMAELGVWRGSSAYALHHTLPDRKLYLFDTFDGFDERDVTEETNPLPVGKGVFKNTSLDYVREFIAGNDNVVFCPGWFPETAESVPDDERFAFVHIDCDLGKPVEEALNFFYPRTNKGGVIAIHDYDSGWFLDVKPAVDKFLKDKPEFAIRLPDKSGTVAIVKAAD